MKKKGYLAFDFGASSGRLMLGSLEDGKLVLEELHRFANDPVYANGTMYWDFLRLLHEMKQGLKKVAHREDIEIQAIGIDTWGVDGGWLDKSGNLLGNPIHYRDSRTQSILEEFEKKLNEEELYSLTGIEKIAFNTVYQMYYDKNKNDVIKEKGAKWLFMPDLFGYMLTGQIYNEYTIASTSGILDASTGEYDESILQAIKMEKSCLSKLVKPGTIVGNLTEAIQEETGLGAIPVVAVGSHDTASAIAAIPVETENEAYLVCGTWCLMGMELTIPCLEQKARQCHMTNEGGVEGTIRFLKNINGLWFLQQLKKVWNEEGDNVSFPDIIEAVRQCEHEYAINAEENRFLAPLNMKKEIVKYCEEVYGITLKTKGEIAKAAYNGLGKLYQKTIKELEELSGKNIDTVRMVGGGIKDQYLCEEVARMTKKRVVAGPIEASALGNVLMQMKATQAITSLQEGRKLIAHSFEQTIY